METETPRPLPTRWLGWCDTCQDHTEPTDDSGAWCMECGERRDN